MNIRESKFHICLDPEKFYGKPAKTIIPRIANRITRYPVAVTLKEITDALMAGQVASPRFSGLEKCNENFELSDTMFIDVDNTDKKSKKPVPNPLQPDEAINRLRRYRIEPSLVYYTYTSSDECPKYRIVIHLDGIVTSGPLFEFLLVAIASMIPECDNCSKKIAQMYFGGQSVFHYNDSAMVSLNNISSAYRSYVYESDKSHAAAKARTHASNFIKLLHHVPSIEDLKSAYACGETKELESPYFSCLFHGSSNESTNLVSLINCLLRLENRNFNSQIECTIPVNADRSTLHESMHKENISGIDKEVKCNMQPWLLEQCERSDMGAQNRSSRRLKNFNFNVLEFRCALWRDFMYGKIHHDEKANLAICLSNIENGENEFFKYYNNPDRDKMEGYKKIFRKHYRPSPCAKYCRYADSCEHPVNICEVGRRRKYGQVERLVTDKSLISSKEGVRTMYLNLDMALEHDDTDVWLQNAPAGIGKTDLILKRDKLRNAIIAAPNHLLKNEIAGRARQMGHDVIVTPELPPLPPYAMSALIRMYRSNPAKAGSFKRALSRDFPLMKKYFDDMERCPDHDGLIVTTHEMLVRLKVNDNRIIVVDEDITQTLLLNSECSVQDVMKLGRHVFENIDESDGKLILDSISTACLPYTYKKNTLCLKCIDKIEMCADGLNLQSNVLGFLSCTSYAVEGGVVIYITKRSLPSHVKVIVMSATADKTIYERLFDGRSVHVGDVQNIRTVGKLVQHTQRSVSRNSLDKYPLLPKSIEEIVCNRQVITYKSHKDKFVNAIEGLHFGMCMGIDAYKGQDLVVVGTPHFNPHVYGLYASALGIHFTPDDFLTFGSTDVCWKGFLFRFPSFKDNLELQHLQLHLIESELVQAVGRNRILREDCTTIVFSNLPLVGAEFAPFDPRLTAKNCQDKPCVPSTNN